MPAQLQFIDKLFGLAILRCDFGRGRQSRILEFRDDTLNARSSYATGVDRPLVLFSYVLTLSILKTPKQPADYE